MGRAVGRTIRRPPAEQGPHVRHLVARAVLASELWQRQTPPYRLQTFIRRRDNCAGAYRQGARRARHQLDGRPEAAKSFAVKTVDRMPLRMERCCVRRDPEHCRHVKRRRARISQFVCEARERFGQRRFRRSRTGARRDVDLARLKCRHNDAPYRHHA
jgi:hypothetical protein